MRTKRRGKGRLVALAVLLVLLVALEIFLAVWFFGARHPAYDGIAREEAEIPFLDEGIAPQGLCALPEGSGYDFAMSGYMSDGAPSRICLIGEGGPKYVTLKEGNEAIATHFGGVACSGGYLLVASGKSVVRVSLAAALAAENGAALEVYDSFGTDMNNAYCHYADGKLYVGEFYRAGNYETARSHRFQTDGGVNPALIYVFEGDEGARGGVKSETPVAALSVRAQVQGVVVTGDSVYLSTSYGLPDSVLYAYDNVLSGGAPSAQVTVNGNEVPVYLLGEEALRASLVAPCMSEEICVVGDRMYVLFESMSVKYKYFVRTAIDRIVSLPLEAFA